MPHQHHLQHHLLLVTNYTIIAKHKQIGWANNIKLYIQFKYMHTHVYHTLIANEFPFLRTNTSWKEFLPLRTSASWGEQATTLTCSPKLGKSITILRTYKQPPLPAHQNPTRAQPLPAHQNPIRALLSLRPTSNNPCLFTKSRQEHNPYLFIKTR